MESQQSMPSITLAIEHMEREFIPKCLLAQELVSRGWRVFIGSMQAIDALANELPESIIFHKSTHPESKRYKELGHFFAFLDEEGGITTPRSKVQEFCEYRYKTLAKDRQDLVFLPGSRFFESVSSMPNTEGVKLEISGWPRVDMWRPELRKLHIRHAEKIKERHGRFFLMPTSFGAASEKGFRKELAAMPTEMFRVVLEQRRESFIKNVEMLKELDALLAPDETLVVRPHASEKITDWKKALRETKNITICRDGDIGPWILSAQALIQTGSTSVVQAAFMGKTNVVYGASKRNGITDTASFELCSFTQDAEELYSILNTSDFYDDSMSRKTQALLTEEMDYNEAKLSVEKIADVLENHRGANHIFEGVSLSVRLRIQAFHFSSAIKTFFQSLGAFRNGRTVYTNLPGGIRRKEVLRVIESLSDLRGITKNFSARQVAPYLVSLEPK